MPGDVGKLIDSLYRKNFATMVTAIARFAGLRELAMAEDAVQEAFAEAAMQWKRELPAHPEAWLYRVCRNIALKKIRDTKSHLSLEAWHASTLPEDQPAGTLEDDQLLMLLACVHPRFSNRNQVIFALRYVAGFRIEQIAALLGSPTDTITKTLQRMRDVIREENVVLRANLQAISSDDAAVVLKVLYLLFSEGSKTSSGKSLLNLELCEDAVSLAQSVVRIPELNSTEAHALFALMLFNLSRFDARFDGEGIPIDLEHQDRSRWNQDLIRVATWHLGQSGQGESSYHLEAAIAYVHCVSPSFAATDWNKISLLYERLARINESPFVRLSQAIAVFYAGRHDEALHMLDCLGETAFMQSYYLFHATLGRFLGAVGKKPESKRHFEKAIALSSHAAEREGLSRMMNAG